MTPSEAPFELEYITHLLRPWGDPARNLDELFLGLRDAPADVLFLHAVQYQLRHPAADGLPPDDLSAWIGGVVQDAETAERFSFAVQSAWPGPDRLRTAMVDVLAAIPAETRVRRDVPEGSEFHFLSSTTVRFPAGIAARDPDELVRELVAADPGVWFCHVIEDPWYGKGASPLVEWVRRAGAPKLAGWLTEAATDGLPVDRSRVRVQRRWRPSRIARQITGAAGLPESVRREAAREVVARLVRRPQAGGGS